MPDRPSLRLATRGSRLAIIQAEEVAALLRARHPDLWVELVTITSRGDCQQAVPLAELQAPDGVFTRGIEAELRAGRAELAVHSLKDLPTLTDATLVLAAFPPRADVRDVLVAPRFGALHRLPSGAVIGTSSPRRRAQLLAARPEARVVPIRGNVDTRLRKLEAGDVDALVLAAAGLERLGLLAQVDEWLPVERFTPAVGQAALAVQCRAEDTAMRALLAEIDHPPTRAAVEAERAFLRALGGGCRVPVGGYAAPDGEALVLRGFVAGPDGTDACWETASGPIAAPTAVGAALAARLLEAVGPRFLAGARDG